MKYTICYMLCLKLIDIITIAIRILSYNKDIIKNTWLRPSWQLSLAKEQVIVSLPLFHGFDSKFLGGVPS